MFRKLFIYPLGSGCQLMFTIKNPINYCKTSLSVGNNVNVFFYSVKISTHYSILNLNKLYR